MLRDILTYYPLGKNNRLKLLILGVHRYTLAFFFKGMVHVLLLWMVIMDRAQHTTTVTGRWQAITDRDKREIKWAQGRPFSFIASSVTS